MAKGDLIRIGIFSILLIVVIGFYSNLGVLSFNNVNISETLPKPIKTKPTVLTLMESMEDHREKNQPKPNKIHVSNLFKEPTEKIIQALRSHAGRSEGSITKTTR